MFTKKEYIFTLLVTIFHFLLRLIQIWSLQLPIRRTQPQYQKPTQYVINLTRNQLSQPPNG